MKSPACSGLGGENFGVFESVAFYESVDAADFGLAPAQRAKAEDIRIIRGEDDPVAFTDSNQETGKKRNALLKVLHIGSPRAGPFSRGGRTGLLGIFVGVLLQQYLRMCALPTQRSAMPFCHVLRKAVRIGWIP